MNKKEIKRLVMDEGLTITDLKDYTHDKIEKKSPDYWSQ